MCSFGRCRRTNKSRLLRRAMLLPYKHHCLKQGVAERVVGCNMCHPESTTIYNHLFPLAIGIRSTWRLSLGWVRNTDDENNAHANALSHALLHGYILHWPLQFGRIDRNFGRLALTNFMWQCDSNWTDALKKMALHDIYNMICKLRSPCLRFHFHFAQSAETAVARRCPSRQTRQPFIL